MIYLTTGNSPAYWERTAALGFGSMLSPTHGSRLALVAAVPIWAADNDCYTMGDRFDAGAWLAWLAVMEPAQATCLFAAVPDVVGDARATLDRWEQYAPAAQETGYRLAFVAQDGQEDLPLPWCDFDALFIGGTTAWKLSRHAAHLVQEAKELGKWVHMGRVNSERRLIYATRLGCDSSDGTYMAINPRKALVMMGRALMRANAPQLSLGLTEATAGYRVATEKGVTG